MCLKIYKSILLIFFKKALNFNHKYSFESKLRLGFYRLNKTTITVLRFSIKKEIELEIMCPGCTTK